MIVCLIYFDRVERDDEVDGANGVGGEVAAEQAIETAAMGGAIGAARLRIFNAAGAVAGVADANRSRVIPKVAEILAVTGEVTGRPIPLVRNPPRNEPRVLIRMSSFCHLFERLSDYWTVARRTGKQG
jgi:hypothetical protein